MYRRTGLQRELETMLSMKQLKELKMFHLHLEVTRQVVTAFTYLTRSINGKRIWFNQEKKIILTSEVALKNLP